VVVLPAHEKFECKRTSDNEAIGVTPSASVTCPVIAPVAMGGTKSCRIHAPAYAVRPPKTTTTLMSNTNSFRITAPILIDHHCRQYNQPVWQAA